MNRHAVFTGASRGIGKAVAKYFAEKNYNLTLIARDMVALAKVKMELVGLNPEIVIDVHSVDLEDYQGSYSTLLDIAENLERIDVLFNNAGVAFLGTLDLSVDDFSKMIDINVKGVFIVAQVFGNIMKENKSGYIFNVASMAGKRSLPSIGGYCASKYAVVGFSSALRQELSSYNVKVTALCPGVIKTDMTKDFDISDEKKMGTSEIINAVEYLLKNGSSTVIESLDISTDIVL